MMRPYNANTIMNGLMITASQIFLYLFQMVQILRHISIYQDLSMIVKLLNGTIFMPNWRKYLMVIEYIVQLIQDLKYSTRKKGEINTG